MIINVANSSFRTATFQQSIKKSQLTPLLKKPGLDTTDFKNFRPITNLTTISNINERLVLQRLRPYLASSPNSCRLPSAYFTSRSVDTALVKIVDDIFGHIDDGSVVALVSLDISAAFDIVDHNLLLEMLSVDFGVTVQPENGLHHISKSNVFSFASDNRHPFVHRMPASLWDQCSVRYFLQYMSPPSVVSSRVLASSTTATLTTFNCTQHSKVTWDRVSKNCRSAPLHCNNGY